MKLAEVLLSRRMMKTIVLRIFLYFNISLVTIFFGCTRTDKKLIVADLRCCNMLNPEGIDFPLLSWKIKSSKEGVSQTAWEVEIASSQKLLETGNADVWKSGKQQSDEQFNIVAKGVNFVETVGYFWRVRITDNENAESSWSKPAYFSIGLLKEKSWTAKWLTYSYANNKPLPYFRKVFNVDKNGIFPKKATIYFCGLGAGELYLNGQMVDSTRFFDPAQTNYEQYALYSTFDATDQLKSGDNCLGVMLGNGWFAQDQAWQGAAFSYGSPMFRLQMVVLYSDGSHSVWGSDEDWQWKEGPVLKSNIYLGELYDARREVEAWCNASTRCTGWNTAMVAHENTPPRLIPQLMEPIRKIRVLKAVGMWQDPSGKWIFDFGENVAGIPYLEIEQPRGTHVTIRVSEEKNVDGSLDFSSLGWSIHGKVFDYEYVCKGGEREQWSPRFSYHGFRFAELSGMVNKPDISTLSLVVVHSDLPVTGTFECADPQVNQLHELAVRTVLSNLHGIPTDCPDREKCGWLGDTHAYVKMANLNLQMNNFWINYLEDIRSGASVTEEKTLFHERYNNTFYFTKKPAGLPYMIAPGKRLCGVASPDWGTAVVQLPWWLYVYYGNTEILRDYYPEMKQWTDYVSSLATDPDRTQKYNRKTSHIVWQGLGDWCPPAGESALNASVEFTSSAFHYLDVCIMEQVSRILEKNDDNRKYREEKKAIAQEVISVLYNNNRKTYGSQTADVMALDFGLVPKGDEKAVADVICQNVNEKSNGFIHCGIFGIGRLGSMLARNGNVSTAWSVFTKKGENSFEWMWKGAGATSLWETLPVNEVTREKTMSDSHNHPMQAGYDVCFYEDIAGIRTDSTGFGFKVIRFSPLFTGQLAWANASIESAYGKVVSNWKKEEGLLDWHICIPPNSSGLVSLPREKSFTVNGNVLDRKKYYPVHEEEGHILFYFPSGDFEIHEIN